MSESMGHAMAEIPAEAARALLYIVGTFPTFFLNQSINHSNHTFHHKTQCRYVGSRKCDVGSMTREGDVGFVMLGL